MCAIVDAPNKSVMSKRGKPLHNFEPIFERFPRLVGIYEVFDTNWETSVTLCRNQKAGLQIDLSQMYRIIPPEPCLHLQNLKDPSEELIKELLDEALRRGDEGLVLWPVDQGGVIAPDRKPVKVKPSITVDIGITGFQEGKGKYENMLGAFITKYGNVSGMDDKTRQEVWINQADYLDAIIEVEAMGWTPGMKLRHPRFKRFRWDKFTENLELDDKE